MADREEGCRAADNSSSVGQLSLQRPMVMGGGGTGGDIGAGGDAGSGAGAGAERGAGPATAAARTGSAAAAAASAPLDTLPNELLLHIFGYLEVCDLLSTSRTNHHLRHLSLAPVVHSLRLRRSKNALPPLLWSRPSLADLMGRRIFVTQTTAVSRRLARSLVSIRLSRRLAARPSPEALVTRSILPAECCPGGPVAPALVAKKRAVEKERVKDGLRRFVAGWTGEVRERSEGVRRWEESRGVGRVWRLKRFWERVACDLL
ncbi:hypothetical protein GGTG_08921 [Gaeumannomyces tritici R3-111a-1]|uniref:F-box domain-containing protein n=1 Tax=Gaeumannomyces tritici (strain R3-111a-1) TaxID=644352 RepID=J3P5Y1_GAET3|nr:hypothetical protein GGTG_08921 [Gaeumannomyces tritici R3-111a-1]EJT75083.1 hypothetical protein GGTG_08921 [Gaeumannomyces tritici R3-111a-1]